jgi:crotonobetainyl-CoA:carnitine CoA-transferase CaiB-like acyl-CoA transferase
MLDVVFASRSAADWIHDLTEVDVPAHRVVSVSEAMSAAASSGRGTVAALDGQRYVPFPVRRDGAPIAEIRTGAPALSDNPREPQEAI